MLFILYSKIDFIGESSNVIKKKEQDDKKEKKLNDMIAKLIDNINKTQTSCTATGIKKNNILN